MSNHNFDHLNIAGMAHSALSVSKLQGAFDRQQVVFRKMYNIGAVTNSALSVSRLQDALDKQQVLFDITQKHFKGYETIQEKIQEFFKAADERQRQLNELLDNSALPLSQPLLPEDFLTTPEKTESIFTYDQIFYRGLLCFVSKSLIRGFNKPLRVTTRNHR